MSALPQGLTWTPLREAPELAGEAAAWFSAKWGIPLAAYQESMADCLAHPDRVPQWYLVRTASGEIVGGLGLIENDFHPRRDLRPNVCAVFVEPQWRNRGIARYLLDQVRRDAVRLGEPALYLLTDHTGFYERCGWTYLCAIQGDDGESSRVYTADTNF